MILLTYQQAYLSAITVANISQSLAYKMAAKLSWHRYGTKLFHCHPMYRPTPHQQLCIHPNSKRIVSQKLNV